MAHMELELARDRQRKLLAEAELRRECRMALARDRIARQAARAERRTANHAGEAARLRARLADMEAGS
jgi:hypothetical protein